MIAKINLSSLFKTFTHKRKNIVQSNYYETKKNWNLHCNKRKFICIEYGGWKWSEILRPLNTITWARWDWIDFITLVWMLHRGSRRHFLLGEMEVKYALIKKRFYKRVIIISEFFYSANIQKYAK